MTLVQIMSPLESQLWRGERIIHIMHLNKYLVIILIGTYIQLILIDFLIIISIEYFHHICIDFFVELNSDKANENELKRYILKKKK